MSKLTKRSIRGLVIAALAGAALAASACGGGGTKASPTSPSTPPEDSAAATAILSTSPNTANGLTVADLMSKNGGGHFDCTDPQRRNDPSAIDHYRISNVESNDDATVVTILYFNETESISQTAIFKYVPSTGEVAGLNPHAATFLNPIQPSPDDC